MDRDEIRMSKCIEYRVNRQETTKCIFDVTVPRCMNYVQTFIKNPIIQEICEIFDKYGIDHIITGAIPGSWSLDRLWIETEIKTPIECAIEYSGVYPVNWDIKDVIKLEKMESSGQIIIKVKCITADGDLVLNCK